MEAHSRGGHCPGKTLPTHSLRAKGEGCSWGPDVLGPGHPNLKGQGTQGESACIGPAEKEKQRTLWAGEGEAAEKEAHGSPAEELRQLLSSLPSTPPPEAPMGLSRFPSQEP